jgi:hypothetical protein
VRCVVRITVRIERFVERPEDVRMEEQVHLQTSSVD